MTKVRRYIEIASIIQGGGFRPFIYRSDETQSERFVKNDGAMVIIDIEGNKENINDFIKDEHLGAPDIALIEAFMPGRCL